MRQLGVRPEHLRDLRLDFRNWAPAFRSGTGVQQTQGDSSSSNHSGTSGGRGGGGSGGAEAAPGVGVRDMKGPQAVGSHQNVQTSAEQAASRHSQRLAFPTI